MWKDRMEAVCTWKTNGVICLGIKDQNENYVWNMLGRYRTPYLCEKLDFWERLQIMVEKEDEPWILFGDLNEVISETEKWGGRSI